MWFFEQEKIVVVHTQLIKYFNLGYKGIFKERNIFRHMKLKIALAIPASNDEKQKQTMHIG